LLVFFKLPAISSWPRLQRAHPNPASAIGLDGNFRPEIFGQSWVHEIHALLYPTGVTKAAVAILDLLLWCIQGIVMLALIVPVQRAGQALTWFSWHVLIRVVYYHGIVIPRRRLAGGQLWRDTDLLLGIAPPPSELERLSRLASN
jgi:hypothetical protein